jgi:hypothetical protein
MVKRLEKRFAPPPQPGLEHQKKGISFDRFLLACVTVKHYTEAFRKWVLFLTFLLRRTSFILPSSLPRHFLRRISHYPLR